jgi:membrane-bound serine protease (ClpP class)
VFDTRAGRLRAEFAGGQAVVDFFNKPVPRFLLVLGGCLGVLIELKTFGLLVPGLVAAACFLTLFVTSLFPVTGSLEGTATAWECLLFVLGAGLVALEFLLLPGMAAFAITGGALCLVGIVLAMVPAGTANMDGAMTMEDAIGILALGFGGGAAAFLMLLKFLPHNPIFARRGLVSQSAIVGVPTADSAIAAQERDMSLLGKTGIAITALHPAGKMETADGEILDVTAQGQFIEQGTSVKVIESRGGQVHVERTAGS